MRDSNLFPQNQMVKLACFASLNKEFWLLALPMDNASIVYFTVKSGNASINQLEQNSKVIDFFIFILIVWISIIWWILIFCYYKLNKNNYEIQEDDITSSNPQQSVREITQSNFQTDRSNIIYEVNNFYLGDNCELNMLKEKISNTLYERNKVENLISIILNAILAIYL